MFYKIIFIAILSITASNANEDFQKVKTFQAKFNQIIKSTADNIIEYKGDVFIKDSGKILWKYKTPIEKNVFVLKNFVIIDEPELEQAIFTQLEKEINIIDLLNNAKKVSTDKYLSKLNDIDYFIYFKNKVVDNISYTDAFDNKVKIEFTNVLKNKEIKETLFEFTAPKDYDIIRK